MTFRPTPEAATAAELRLMWTGPHQPAQVTHKQILALADGVLPFRLIPIRLIPFRLNPFRHYGLQFKVRV